MKCIITKNLTGHPFFIGDIVTHKPSHFDDEMYIGFVLSEADAYYEGGCEDVYFLCSEEYTVLDAEGTSLANQAQDAKLALLRYVETTMQMVNSTIH